MNRYVIFAIGAWALFSVIALLLWGFAGIRLWVPLQACTDGRAAGCDLREFFIACFLLGGVAAGLMVVPTRRKV